MWRFAFAVLAACGATSAPVASGGAPPPPAATTDGPPPADPSDDLEAGLMASAAAMGGDPESRFGPIELGGDYLRYRKVTPEPFLSKVHGNRWVDVYVNEIGADAYLSGADIPDGTIVVKTSWLDEDGAPSSVAGPIYIMAKRPPGSAPEHDGWYFAIHWAKPPAEDARRFGGPVYWRGNSPRAAFCWECHESYDRSLGGLVPSSLVPR